MYVLPKFGTLKFFSILLIIVNIFYSQTIEAHFYSVIVGLN